MTRKYIDCREAPGEANCTIAISADDAQELEEAAVLHAVTVHHHDDGPELRQHIRQAIREGSPADAPVAAGPRPEPNGRARAAGQGPGG